MASAVIKKKRQLQEAGPMGSGPLTYADWHIGGCQVVGPGSVDFGVDKVDGVCRHRSFSIGHSWRRIHTRTYLGPRIPHSPWVGRAVIRDIARGLAVRAVIGAIARGLAVR